MNNSTKQFEDICIKMVNDFASKQDLEFDGWIGNDIGGISEYSNTYFFDIHDIYKDLKTNQPKGFILQWHDDGIDHNWSNDNPIQINYTSYIMGLRYDQLIDNKEIALKEAYEWLSKHWVVLPIEKRIEKYLEYLKSK